MPSELIYEFCIADEVSPDVHEHLWKMYVERALRQMSPMQVIASRPVGFRPSGQGLTRYGFLTPYPLDVPNPHTAAENIRSVPAETKDRHDHG